MKRLYFMLAAVLVALAAAIAIRFRASQEPLLFSVEHDPPAGWRKEEGTPSTLFLYREPKSGAILSGSLNIAPKGIAALSGPEQAARMVSTPLKMQLLGEVQSRDVVFGLVSRGGWDATSITALGSKGRTTVVISLSGPNGKVVREWRPALDVLLKSVQLHREPGQ